MSVLRASLDAAKKWLLPRGRQFRRVRYGPAAGCWMRLDLQHEMRIYLGLYELELSSTYTELLQPGMKSFDIGGRDGYSALLIARKTGSEVISFECESAGAAEMDETFRRNDLPVRAVQAFVGKAVDSQTTLTVDDAADRYFAPDFLKIDVEGGEADVLKGARRVLSEKRPSMIIEVHGVEAERDCIAILGTHGYRFETIDRRRIFREERPLAHNRWLACRPV